ncbi:MAG: serine/threonine protein kinase [Calothrix sp. FI2-JRJ7]|jgi:serine/threonine protein kinase|nr:serine/threonine protein kinase [Calothrix sp. FI2-JRJ7]
MTKLPKELFNNRYQIQEELGRNTGRRTFLAQDLETKQLVVIKLLIFNENFRWDDLKLFEREVETLKSLSHPAIPKYIEYFSVDIPSIKGFAFVQSYINARPLQEYLDSGRTFSESEVKQLAKSLLLVLDYLHSHQPPVIHRDIKPSNILLVNCSAHHIGDVYLVDFGSVQTATPHDGTMTIVGTYGYMAPEQFAGKVSCASDLYSLGATLIHLVTGIEPIDLPSSNLQIQFEEAVNISSTFRDWLKLMTHPSLNKRFNSVQSANTALESGELTIKKPPLSNITLTKIADCINICIPYGSFPSTKKSYWQVINNIKRDYRQAWYTKIFDIVSLRGFWTWLICVFICSVIAIICVGFPIIAFLMVLPESIRYLFIFLAAGSVIMSLTTPNLSFNIKDFYKGTIPDDNIRFDIKNLRYVDALHLNINQQDVTLAFTYPSQAQTTENYIIFKQPRQNISKITFENKSYKIIETGTDENGKKQTEQKEIPPRLYIQVAQKRYGLNYKLTAPELYWLAEELSYFLDIPITWE